MCVCGCGGGGVIRGSIKHCTSDAETISYLSAKNGRSLCTQLLHSGNHINTAFQLCLIEEVAHCTEHTTHITGTQAGVCVCVCAYVCVCVCVCRACVRACVRVCVHAFIQQVVFSCGSKATLNGFPYFPGHRSNSGVLEELCTSMQVASSGI